MPRMAKKGFPSFGLAVDGVKLSGLSSYAIPPLVMRMVAARHDSDLAEKGSQSARLQSLNDPAIDELHKAFVLGDPDPRFAAYRFYAFMSGLSPKAMLVPDEEMPGAVMGRRFDAVLLEGGLCVMVAAAKVSGNPASAADVRKFREAVQDVLAGEQGGGIRDALFATSVGVTAGAIDGMKPPIQGIVLKLAVFGEGTWTVDNFGSGSWA